ncbi:3-oxoacyl-ACP reductase [Thalassobacillus devorans]|uniref:3-oxoacyl-ACP reductase n=1 Tax=Thalassobacillus devorans TaxID=279813 RepID=A0ABQ1NGE3_9BACI|nr:3-oxoacyl-ACP reductase [Thalassobacillus devorans]NIK27179.1 3-oxoacyl-[acyl-carrier protein] reductase [Thalassobacillus devorans]GGC75635.1 3-oxoacyl-ACP reductase [Thalassobacillus devorans]
MQLNKQTVLITGASRGLGAAIAEAFANEGANVIINYFKSKQKAEELVERLGDNAIAVQADIRDKNQVDEMVDRAVSHFGTPLSTVINNALVDFRFDPGAQKNAAELEWDNFQTQIEGTVKGSLNAVQAGLAYMKELGFGRIINIGTNLLQNPVVAYHEYTTGKAALLGFTRNMAKELGQYGITVNMVSGGLLKETDASSVTTGEVFGMVELVTPLQKATSPQELADAVLFFASPWARAVTGQNLVVDGGLVMD